MSLLNLRTGPRGVGNVAMDPVAVARPFPVAIQECNSQESKETLIMLLSEQER